MYAMTPTIHLLLHPWRGVYAQIIKEMTSHGGAGKTLPFAKVSFHACPLVLSLARHHLLS